MAKYAQILYGKAHWIFESETTPQFASDIVIVNLPSNSQVKEGWDYNSVSGVFSPPIEQPINSDPKPKSAEEIALEIQQKQAEDTLIKFDGIATIFEDLHENDLIKFQVLAEIYEKLEELEDKINGGE